MINEKREFCKSLNKLSHHLKKIVEDTDKDFKERLVNFCSKDGEIRLSNICIGTSCEIPGETIRLLKCKPGEKIIGDFHTHRQQDLAELSGSDILHAIGNDIQVSCLGRGGKKTVTCYTYPYGLPISMIENYVETLANYTKKSEEYKIKKDEKTRRQLIKSEKAYKEQNWQIAWNYAQPDVVKERNKNSCKIILK